MRLSRLNVRKINLNDVDINYSGQDILMKLGNYINLKVVYTAMVTCGQN